MKTISISSWNVNSIRARQPSVMTWLGRNGPDLLCLQETKVEDEKFPSLPFEEMGYQVIVFGEKRYNGVAVLSRLPVDAVRKGFPEEGDGQQKRLLALLVKGVWVINVYVPNGRSIDSPKFSEKLRFMVDLRDYLERYHRADQSLLLLGDFNVAPDPIDVCSPEEWERDVLFHPEARAAFAGLMKWGLVDLFRMHHSDPGQYTWWDYRMGSYRRNLGLRIDHLLGTVPLSESCSTCEIDRIPRGEATPSDHAPITAVFDAGGISHATGETDGESRV